MTAYPTDSQASKSPAIPWWEHLLSLSRILLGGLFLSLLVAGCLYLYHTAFPFYEARLLEEESKTAAWIIGELGFALPFVVICLFHTIAYWKHDRDGRAEREMLWQIVIVAVMTYGVLLPALSDLSDAMYTAAVEVGATIPKTDGGVEWTLMMKLHEWFIRFTVPLAILCVFRAMRVSRERRFPHEPDDEPLMTVEAYNALHGIGTDEPPTTDALEETEVDHVEKA